MRKIIFLLFAIFFATGTGYFLYTQSSWSLENPVTINDSHTETTFLETLADGESVKKSMSSLPYIKVYTPDPLQLHTYLEITNSCTTVVDESCAKVYATTSTSSAVRAKLRVGSVFLVNETITASDGTVWYSIGFDEPLRFSDRLTLPWFVPATVGELFSDIGEVVVDVNASTSPSKKSILVDRGDQMLYAYDGDDLFMETPVSTGLFATPTPRGIFSIYRKTPTRYMQGPIAGVSDQYYDLPGVPWNLYFTKQGAVVHGTFWHDSFGQPWSHGCVNLSPDIAKKLYIWADVGMTITVRD